MPRIKNIKGPLSWLGILVDVAMLTLTTLDLLWLMFDALYSTKTFSALIDPIFPFYNEIHNDFYYYDAIIVGIFIVEFVGRWIVALYRKSYDKWFFYPFANWYDILGCFPTSTFRLLRLFRIIGLTYRLHEWGVIDLNNLALYRIFKHYYNIMIEEISDRVVIKVLSEAREEIKRGDSLSDEIAEKVIQPRQSELAEMITKVIQNGLREKYPQYQDVLKRQINNMVRESIGNNDEILQIARIPMVGKQLHGAINSATSEIVFSVIDTLVTDASDPENKKMICLILESFIDILINNKILNETKVTKEIITESIDLIIERVNVKQWKIDAGK